MNYEMIKTLAKIVNEAEVLKKMARDALNSIPINNYEEYIKYYSAKSSEKTVTPFNDCHISDFTFPYHIDEIKKDPLSVQEYCKKNRCWAAKDNYGAWHSYCIKPEKSEFAWITKGKFDLITNKTNSYFPDVPWDKSLVAPDGRLILIEGKKEKKKKEAKFKAGKWYKNKTNNSMVHCKRVIAKDIIEMTGIDNRSGAVFCVKNLSDWYEVKHYNPNKKKKGTGLKRGEPIFVWEGSHDGNAPVMVRYFHSYYGHRVWVFDMNHVGVKSCWYQYYRKYDPRLVGVPRKDWEEMPYA